ncbi:MAG: hypothetical protein JWN40_1087 [Phycisphaerales bacterium]|nr:hypothetical protein [Phycisphaerales bacterium]
MAKSFLPASDSGLLGWTVHFRTLIQANPVLYGLTAPIAAAYGLVSVAYEEAYQTAFDPSTRTRGNVCAKNAARAALKHQANLLAKIVAGTASVTDAQKASLGLNVRAKPTPVPPPAFAPAITIVSTSGNTVRLKLRDLTISRRGRPPGVDGAVLFSFVGASAPTSQADWRFETNTTKTTAAITFASTVPPGARVWFTAFWFNPRAQRGPASMPIGTNIPGGSAMAA